MNQTLLDLKDDFEECRALASSAHRQLWNFEQHLEKMPFAYTPETYRYLCDQLKNLAANYQALISSIHTILSSASTWTDSNLNELHEQKRTHNDLLRTYQSMLGAVLSAGDWQSPTFLASMQPQAGKHTGKITGTMSDYKRDWHMDADAYEILFRKEYLDAKWRIPPHVFLTSSGMAAFSTVLQYLVLEEQVKGPVLVGKESYFENRWILERAFSDQVHVVDERDSEAMMEAVQKLRPQAVFLDTLCNDETIAMLDVKMIIPELLRSMPKNSFLVLDNSGLSVTYQPFHDIPRLRTNARLIVIESLNKYYQFGFDRVTGGVIWTTGGFPTGLNKTRMHLGTNIPDVSVLSLPIPNRALLEKRLARLGRNARILSERLDAVIKKNPHTQLSHVVYPHGREFCGSFFVLAFKLSHQQPSVYKTFLSRVIDQANKQQVPLVAGTSFGMNTTRVYLTALHATDLTKPFLRVSVGTETMTELDQLESVFTAVINQMI